MESGELDIMVRTNNSPGLKYGEIRAGMGFGEIALLCNTPRAATIKATTDCMLWALDRQAYRTICAHYELLRREKALRFLKNMDVLKPLSEPERLKLATALEWQEYDEGTTIIREGEIGEDFYIIESGHVSVYKKECPGEEVIHLGAGECFGEMALLKDETRSATCIATSPVMCLSLGREHFIAMLGSLEEMISRNRMNSETQIVEVIPKEVKGQHYLHDIEFNDLEIIRILGCGAFGTVRLVKHRPTGNTFALKSLVKSMIVANNLNDHVENECHVMEQLNHPFILKLYNTYKDKRYVHFLVELALGGELFTHLQKRGSFSEKDTRFYAASVILAFEEIHKHDIVYRDLKPENLILDSQGYVKVIDFGLAKVVKNNRTFTLCGTPDYLAPEIILNKGHGRAVDYWALGILIYELSVGYVPFEGEEPLDVYKLVLQGNMKYPPSLSRSCCDLIGKLLCMNPARRLGNLKYGIKDIMKHKWFAGFNWEDLLKRHLTPPIEPKVKNNLDASNFEQIDEIRDKARDCDWDPAF